MRLLVASDFHGKSSSESNLEEFLKDEDYDVMLILGDITQLGSPCQAKKILERIEHPDVKMLSVPGNCDPKEILGVLDNFKVNLHSDAVRFGDMTFVGFGGSNKTPFSTPFELTESEIWEDLDSLTENLKEWILVTHVPPHGTKSDLTSSGIHAGSKSVRKIVEKKQPLVNFCAHIHEARSVDTIGETTVVNAGSISDGYAAEAVIDDGGVEVNLLHLDG